MILTEDKAENYVSIGDDDYIEAGIDAESLPLFFELMSKAIYANPIGSICREIVSNCYDANVENNKASELVIVSLNEKWGEYSIEFKDKGIGLSEERIQKVFMNYLSSTKRKTNTQIGGFGLGSKSPLAYKDYFEIITVNDGYYYEYIYHRGETKPRIENLIKKPVDESTEKIISGSGTIIKIEIDNYSDFYKFKEEIKKQTCYFDNVYVIGIDTNNYKIYNKQYYKYRNNYQYSSQAHILLGNVAYPIIWNELGIDILNIPIGIKFEIGELQVTPNRENVRYTDEAKILIKERVELAKQELISEFNAQNPEITNFAEYLKRRKETAVLRFNDADYISLSDLGISNNYTFLPLKDINIPEEYYFAYRKYHIKGASVSKKTYYVTERELNYTLFAFKGLDRYNNIYHNNKHVIAPKELSRKDRYNLYCSELLLENVVKKSSSERTDLSSFHNGLFRKQTIPNDLRLRLPNETDKEYQKRLKKWVIENPYTGVQPVGKALKIYRYKKVVEKYIQSISTDYYVVDEDWIEDYKAEQKRLYRERSKKNTEVVRYYSVYGTIETKIVSDFDNYVFVFYKEKGDSQELIKYHKLINESETTWKNKVLFVELQETNLKKLKDSKNLYHIDTFFRIKRLYNFFKKAQIAIKIHNKHYDIDANLMKRVSKYYYDKYDRVMKFKRQFTEWGTLDSFETQLNEVAVRSKIKLDISEDFKIITELYKKLNILHYVDYYIPDVYLLQILKPYKLRHLNESLWKTSKLNKLGKTSS